MSESNRSRNKACVARCERAFLDCQNRSYTGCVEEIRECREKCPVE